MNGGTGTRPVRGTTDLAPGLVNAQFGWPVHFRDEIVEVATFRSPALEPDDVRRAGGRRRGPPSRLDGIVKSEDGLILHDNVFGTPEQDARRRDYPERPLLQHRRLFHHRLRRRLSGHQDRRIRSIGDPNQRFIEDPVRMIRRCASPPPSGSPSTPRRTPRCSPTAVSSSKASSGRMFEEVRKLPWVGPPVFELLHATGLFTLIFPVAQGALPAGEGVVLRAPAPRAVDWVDAEVAAGEPVEHQPSCSPSCSVRSSSVGRRAER